MEKLDYTEAAVDGGVKYRGFSLMGEYYWRTLDNFVATGALPIASIHDHGFMAEASYMIVPKRVDMYAVGGYIWDAFRRNPWETGGGLNYYPSGTRSWRLNMHLLHIDKSPASSFFGYYQPGQTGTIFSLGVDVLL